MDWQTGDAAARELLEAAWQVRGHAYARYSNFAVGAAVRLTDGSLVGGCNVENASYGLTVCAERVAVQRAVAEGWLTAEARLAAVAVVAGGAEPLTPCGGCRQVLAEFAAPECVVWCGGATGAVQRYLLADLLPAAFTLR